MVATCGTHVLRYLAPNAVTVLGLLMGLGSILAAHEGRFETAAWLVIWAVLFDRVDGLVARGLRATSEFGMHMDSFADAVDFGVAPAFLVWCALGSDPSLGFALGPWRWFLALACALWVVANVVRLARFNVVSGSSPGVFFGVPTTLAAGLLTIWFLVGMKYVPAESSTAALRDLGPHAFGSASLPPTAFAALPWVMLVFAVLMVTAIPLPKLGRGRTRLRSLWVVSLVLLGYGLGLARTMPEIMALLPTIWLLWFLPAGVRQARAGVRPARLFPRASLATDSGDDLELGADLGQQRG
jgi:CDP-diacylglycerol--serine O-phosphatidyltransferase